jgi:hypothetical protein
VSVLIRFSPASLTADQYDQAVRRLTEEGVFPADGLDYEICFGPEGHLSVSQVWDTHEQLEAFGARLQPILVELGIDPGEPQFLEVHNVIHRGEVGWALSRGAAASARTQAAADASAARPLVGISSRPKTPSGATPRQPPRLTTGSATPPEERVDTA